MITYKDATTIPVAVQFRVSWHQSNSAAHISESWQLPGCKRGPEAGNSKLHGESLQAKPNTATRGICVRTIVRRDMRKEVETHNPKWEEVYEGSGVITELHCVFFVVFAFSTASAKGLQCF